ncbi:MAG TPA: YerC/YecD family TrpR-related protein [Gaiellaceae bacterium]|nr:YerC/YecD family TrpR-related protein [Gaiellaceae bacterium]
MSAEQSHATTATVGTGTADWRTRETRELFEAILALGTVEEAERFFRDLCTLAELEAMTHRWHAARLVDEGLPYHEVSRKTGASTTTVTRVAHWLRHGEGGYRLAIDRLRARSSSA